MQSHNFRLLHTGGETHWWIKAKNEIVFDVMSRAGLRNSHTILDAGGGAGVFAHHVQARGFNIVLFDASEEALTFAQKRGVRNYSLGSIDTLPFPDQSFDVVTALDVLEHMNDDRASLREIKRVLRPGGLLILTVPAHPWLYGMHDQNLGHVRRYTYTELKKKLADLGFQYKKLSYYNFFLFFPIAFFRILVKLIPRVGAPCDDLELTSKFLNLILYRIFILEKYLLRIVNLPIGISLIGVFRNAK